MQVARLLNNSSTSSKPPKAKPSNTGKSRGQKGHPGFWRNLFKAEQIDEIKEYRLSACPECKIPLNEESQTKPWIQQTAEIPEKLIHVTEHRRLGYVCPKCQKQLYAALPEGVKAAELFDPNLISLRGYLKGALHGS